MLTTQGFSGDQFRGQDRFRKVHIEELQIDRNQLELDFGLEQTDFSSLAEHGFHIRRTHIIELRESTEKLLDSLGITLEEHFSNDTEGNPIVLGPNDTVKTDWTDVQRGLAYLDKSNEIKTEFIRPSSGPTLCPTLPENTRYRAIHIEDLRRLIPTGWREFWTSSICDTSLPASHAGDLIVRRPTPFTPPYIPVFDYALTGHLEYGPSFFNYGDASESAHIVYDVINPQSPYPLYPILPNYNYANHVENSTNVVFPLTALDIFPSNGGTKYLINQIPAYPDDAGNPQRTWPISGFTQQIQRNLSRTDGITVETSATSLASASNAKILPQTFSTVSLFNGLAKPLRLSVTIDGSVVAAREPPDEVTSTYLYADEAAFGQIAAAHNWVLDNESIRIPKDFAEGVGLRDVKVNFKTHFKFLVTPTISQQYLDGLSSLSTLINYWAPVSLRLDLGFDLAGIGTRYLSIRCSDPLPYDATEVTYAIYNPFDEFKAIDSPVHGPQTQVIDGFRIYAPQQFFGSNPNPLFKFWRLYLGNKPVYDEAINLNDLFLAMESYWHVGYVDNSMPNPTPDDGRGPLISNPLGTIITFKSLECYLGGGVSPFRSFHRMFYPQNDGNTFNDTGYVHASALIEALRIENNPKKVADYV